MKILLVEDEEMLNGITAKYLRAENMTVDTCFKCHRYGYYDACIGWH